LLHNENPILYQVNAHTWLAHLSRQSGRELSLADVPDTALDELAGLGFDLIWLMGIWTKGELGRRIALDHPDVRREYDDALPGWSESDVIGSPFAIKEYVTSPALGGDDALLALRRRLAERGMRLILDLVPNHTARDHPWVAGHPEYYVTADASEADAHPDRYSVIETCRGPVAVAFGKDPYFPGWTDTAQLDYRRSECRDAMIGQLRRLESLCDGLRCDMAMLVLEDVFAQTWGGGGETADPSFWSEAIGTLRRGRPDFVFIAEAYWGLAPRLQDLGFDFTYDKGLYDHLCSGDWTAARDTIHEQGDRLRRGVHFVENHDEPPAGVALPWPRLRSAAALVGTLPGMRFYHEGQFDGRRTRLPVQLARAPEPAPDPESGAFYRALLTATLDEPFRCGRFRWLESCEPGGGYNESAILACVWELPPDSRRLVAVNLSPEPARGYYRLGAPDLVGGRIRLVDQLSGWTGVLDEGLAAANRVDLELEGHQARILRLTRELTRP